MMGKLHRFLNVRAYALALGAAVGLAGLLTYSWPGAKPLRFADLAELRSWAEARGYHCRYNNPGDRTEGNLLVSTDAVTFEATQQHAARLKMSYPGKVWAVKVTYDAGGAVAVDAGPRQRVWGDVAVAGDEALLDGLEQGLRNE
jgi:hypothetical protein